MLAWPRYGSYYLFFTNVLKRSAIERLAEADEHEVVREVQVGLEARMTGLSLRRSTLPITRR